MALVVALAGALTAGAATQAGATPALPDAAPPPPAVAVAAIDGVTGNAPTLGALAAPDQLTTGVRVGQVTMTPVGTDRPARLADGRAYYADTATDTTTVVEGSGDGARIMTVAASRNAPTAYTYRLSVPAGTRAYLTSRGGVSIGNTRGSVAEIDTPWARDAEGRILPTRYTISGDQLVQHIDTRGAVFPVVADPHLRRCGFLGAFGCLTLTRSETQSVSGAFVVGLGAATGAFCGIIPWMPPWAGAVKLGCIAVVAAYYWALRDTFAKAQAQKRCVETKWMVNPTPVPPNGIVLVGHRVVDC